MAAISEQLKYVRFNIEDQKISQQAFADRLGVTRNFIAQIEMGIKMPSDRTIKDICRIFGVNETWLRTGEGDMKAPASKEQDIASITMQMFNLPEDSFRYQLEKYISNMPDEQLEMIRDIIVDLAEAIKAEKK